MSLQKTSPLTSEFPKNISAFSTLSSTQSNRLSYFCESHFSLPAPHPIFFLTSNSIQLLALKFASSQAVTAGIPSSSLSRAPLDRCWVLTSLQYRRLVSIRSVIRRHAQVPLQGHIHRRLPYWPHFMVALALLSPWNQLRPAHALFLRFQHGRSIASVSEHTPLGFTVALQYMTWMRQITNG